MKKLRRILFDDFEQLSPSEAAQFVGGVGGGPDDPPTGGYSSTTEPWNTYNNSFPQIGGSISSSWYGTTATLTLTVDPYTYGTWLASTRTGYEAGATASYNTGNPGPYGIVGYGSNSWGATGGYNSTSGVSGYIYTGSDGAGGGIGYHSGSFTIYVDYNASSGTISTGMKYGF
ncbi:hypothetical protein BDE36_3283 [Arcticibacter tournemirensis]|uniref:hypothetical protein n=1 Tax=Arcticibacter tournemirensis TaxID=699437 RepID=UPI00115469B2|nr:hypothetical protein [Arcticibacter tournemirensis]TQM51505.1 hypothetical protein BDE36_3283 [Arcticibacter tournemirensis]